MNNYARANSHDEVNDQDVQNLQNLMNFLMKSRSWCSRVKPPDIIIKISALLSTNEYTEVRSLVLLIDMLSYV